MFTINTNRLHLRPFQGSDLAGFAAYRSDPEVARYQSWTAPYSPQQAADFLEEMARTQPGTPGAWYQLAVERRSQPGLIGDCAFQVCAHDDRQASIGFTFSRPFQHQGYATEAVQSLLGFLFPEYDLHRITAVCDARNSRSARLLERVGMRREAQFLENVWFKGNWGDEYLYAILRREWAQARGVEETRDHA